MTELGLRLFIYFVIGGLIVSSVAFLGGAGRGLLSAFVTTFPVLTLVTIFVIHREGGPLVTLSYVRGLLWFSPAWMLYLVTFLLTFPRWGIGRAMAAAVLAFLGGVAATRLLLR